MAVITEIINVAMGITAIAFNAPHGMLYLELDMKYVCAIDRRQLDSSVKTKIALYARADDTFDNIVLHDAPGFLHWTPHVSTGSIVTMLDNTIALHTNFKSPKSTLKIALKDTVYKVFPNAGITAAICIFTQPKNPDFDKTCAGMYLPESKSFTASSTIESSELAIECYWNDAAAAALLLDGYSRSLYIWETGAKDAVRILPPLQTPGFEIAYHVNDDATMVAATASDTAGIIKNIWTAKVDTGGCVWSKPLLIKAATYAAFAINTAGNAVCLLENAPDGNYLTVLDIRTGAELARNRLPDSCYGVGLGWLTNDEVICAGSDALFRVKLSSGAAIPAGMLKIKR